MTFSEAWLIEAARDVLRPVYLLESRNVGIGAPVLLSSHDVPGGYSEVLVPSQCSVSWGTLSLDSWTVSGSSLSIAAIPFEMARLRKGSLMVLRMGWEGWDVDDFEEVFVGTLQGAGDNGNGLVTLSIAGIETSMQQRWRLVGANISPALFAGVGQTTTLSANSPSGGSVFVNDDSIFDRPDGGKFGMLITPSSGDPFYLTAGTNPASGEFSDLDAVLDTAATLAVTGDEVKAVLLDEEHPVTLALRIITSEYGNGDNGEHDVYPYGWGLGLPVDLVDVADSLVSQGLAGPDGLSTPSWWLHVREEVEAAGQWLSSWLAAGGFFLCQRQGKLTVRGLQPFESQPILATITDEDIISVNHDALAGPTEAHRFTAYDHADMQGVSVAPTVQDRTPDVVRQLLGALGELLPSIKLPDERSATLEGEPWARPTQGERERVVPVFGSNADRDKWLDSLVDRLGVYATRTPEVDRVRLGGLHWARLAIGDAVSLSTERVHSRRGADDLATKGGRHIIIGGGPDLFGLTTELITVYVPLTEEG